MKNDLCARWPSGYTATAFAHHHKALALQSTLNNEPFTQNRHMDQSRTTRNVVVRRNQIRPPRQSPYGATLTSCLQPVFAADHGCALPAAQQVHLPRCRGSFGLSLVRVVLLCLAARIRNSCLLGCIVLCRAVLICECDYSDISLFLTSAA